MSFRILYQDPFLVAIEKPSGFYVHPPEESIHKIRKNLSCLHSLRDQINSYLYPVHRIDRATSGVLIFALDSQTAHSLCKMFEHQKIKKTYYCIIRGWINNSVTVDYPLKSETNGEIKLSSLTSFQSIAQIEIQNSVGKYSTSRYSMIIAQPKTGRKHQIRRHLHHISHPIIGDTIYGNSEHNHFFKKKLDLNGLLLKSYSIEFTHPNTGLPIKIKSKWNTTWHTIFDLFNICPVNYLLT